ncbi:PREDICTED: uncharacterized protein LOC104733292 [Camelina sativa]|uniref:Uncharacterized protein LOC104733292 n=1 Tax=Camelina sativa TaxID=90675 RepID=A0ABM0V5P8_CAMSA|nr:PREDICTED: uncharacterized protein LOC104733292 [Camelina sativa]
MLSSSSPRPCLYITLRRPSHQNSVGFSTTSQLLNRLLKPSVCKNVIRYNNTKGRMFCSKPTHSYLLIDHLLKTNNSHNDQVYYDDKYKEKLVIKDKGLREEVRVAMTDGIPHNKDGYRVTLGKSEDDSTNLMLVSNTPSDSVKLHLPPLPSSSRIQNVAMSNSPNMMKDELVVAVKLLGSDVYLCEPFSGSCSQWINIHTSGSVHPFSSLMYSKKNNKFLTVCPSGLFYWSLDLHAKEKEDFEPNFHYLCNQRDHVRKVLQTNLEGFIWCSRTDHFVESPSGEHFLVKWFGEDDKNWDKETIYHKTKGFLVFRVDTICGDLVYTEDIGDLCIFLGHNEACCVPASSSPGLRPNSIYYVGRNFGVHDIAADISTTFYAKDEVLLTSTEFPYWPAPSY